MSTCTSRIDIDDLYDLGEGFKRVHHKYFELNKKLKLKELKEANSRLFEMISEIDDICESQNVCPCCGGDIVTEEIKDNVSGDYTIRHCDSCGQEF